MRLRLLSNQPLDQFIDEILVAVGAGMMKRLVASPEDVSINMTTIDREFK